MNINPKISILMNCLNGEEFLESAISSVMSQTYTNWELIFYNNASVDQSKNIFLSFTDERLKYFERTSTIEIALARNDALLHASGAWIAILDVDDVWSHDKLEKQLQALEDNHLIDPKVIFTSCEVLENNKKIYINQDFSPDTVFNDLLSLNLSVPWSSVLINKETFFSLQGFNSIYPSAHDLDFLIRCAKRNTLFHVDMNLVSIRHHKNSLSSINKNKKGNYYFEIMDVLKPYLEFEAAVLGTSKMKLSYIFLLFKNIHIITLCQTLIGVSRREFKYFFIILYQRFF
jgi:glycosyltransferase involved in cell wall biosynthesis